MCKSMPMLSGAMLALALALLPALSSAAVAEGSVAPACTSPGIADGSTLPTPRPVASAAAVASVSPAPTSIVGAVGGCTTPASPAEAVAIEIEAFDPYFRPTEVRVRASEPSPITLVNRGYVAHNLTVDELAIELVASRGGSDGLTLVDPPVGVYTFYCSVSGHREAGMEGTLIIE